jgi:hypothetical protein
MWMDVRVRRNEDGDGIAEEDGDFQRIKDCQITFIFLFPPTDDQDEVISIIEEAAAVRAVLKHDLLQCEGRHASLDELGVLLLTELQHQQDAELARLLLKLPRMVSAQAMVHQLKPFLSVGLFH